MAGISRSVTLKENEYGIEKITINLLPLTYEELTAARTYAGKHGLKDGKFFEMVLQSIAIDGKVHQSFDELAQYGGYAIDMVIELVVNFTVKNPGRVLEIADTSWATAATL